ncbi:hypothetical protein V8C37DRAFT_369917, partial [Trichoderma ceciliae]
MQDTIIVIVATISEDVLRERVKTKASRGQKCRGLPSVWCPPMPCPPGSVRIILSRDLLAAATVFEICQKGGAKVRNGASRLESMRRRLSALAECGSSRRAAL